MQSLTNLLNWQLADGLYQQLYHRMAYDQLDEQLYNPLGSHEELGNQMEDHLAFRYHNWL